MKKVLCALGIVAVLVVIVTGIWTNSQKTCFAGSEAIGGGTTLGKSEPATITLPGITSKSAVLVVQNHCSDDLKLPLTALADMLTAHLTQSGFSVINPHNAIGLEQNVSAAGEKMPGASAVNIGRALGASGVLTASVLEFTSRSLGSPPDFYRLKTRLALTLVDFASGKSVCSFEMREYSEPKE